MLLRSIAPNLRIIDKPLSLYHLLPPYLGILHPWIKLQAIVNIEWVHLTSYDIQIVWLIQNLGTSISSSYHWLVNDHSAILYHASIQLVIVDVDDLIYKATLLGSVVLLRLHFVYVHTRIVFVCRVRINHVLTVQG